VGEPRIWEGSRLWKMRCLSSDSESGSWKIYGPGEKLLFVLSQRDNDVVIIDQPEVDLNNQTIYEDVNHRDYFLSAPIRIFIGLFLPDAPCREESSSN
jgi:hypothetical protein